jgi:transcriptional regulator with XRE-family HTH domain
MKFNYKVADIARQKWGEFLRDRRIERGWTQDELAEMMGVHRNRIIEMESGKKNYSINQFIAVIGCLRGEVFIEWKDPTNDVPGFGTIDQN